MLRGVSRADGKRGGWKSVSPAQPARLLTKRRRQATKSQQVEEENVLWGESPAIELCWQGAG